MEIIYARGKASAAEVREALPDPPSYSAVRALLRILESKGHLRHELDGPRYIYVPTQDPVQVRRHSLRRLVDTLFSGSPTQVVATLLDVSRDRLTEEDYRRLAELIEQAKEDEA
ncbi:MAG: BlaI/MecI/CopY family transcriptional regulator [Acidobacteriota bacterium]